MALRATLQRSTTYTLYCHDVGSSIGQDIASSKENEQVALRRAINKIDIPNVFVAGDAMHTQIETAQQLVEDGKGFIFNVKANQKGLLDALSTVFADGRFRRITLDEAADCVSGRITERTVSVIDARKVSLSKLTRGKEWEPLIKTVIKIERYTETKKSVPVSKIKRNRAGKLVVDKNNEYVYEEATDRPEVSDEIAYFISSIPYNHPNVAFEIMTLIRQH